MLENNKIHVDELRILKNEHIVELVNNIDKRLLDEFKKLDKTHYQLIIEKCIKTLDEEIFDKNGYTAQIRTKYKHYWRKQKKRWLDKAVKDLENGDFTDTKNCFYSLYMIHESQPEFWHQVYGERMLQDVAQENLSKVRKWQTDDKQFLFQYSGFIFKEKSEKRKALELDLKLLLISAIHKDTSGNANDYYTMNPLLLFSSGIIGEKKELTLQENEDGDFQMDMYDKDIAISIIARKEETKGVMRVLNHKDILLLSHMFNRADINFHGTGKVVVSKKELARTLYAKPNKLQYEEPLKRIENMTGKTIKFETARRRGEFSIIDNWEILKDENGNDTDDIEITMGGKMREAFTDNAIIYLSKDKVNSLQRDISRSICFMLQRDRIIRASLSASEMTFEYSIAHFRTHYMFKTNSKKDILNCINDSLDEFKQAKFIVKDYQIIGEKIKVEFYPLSSDERTDIGNINTVIEADHKLRIE